MKAVNSFEIVEPSVIFYQKFRRLVVPLLGVLQETSQFTSLLTVGELALLVGSRTTNSKNPVYDSRSGQPLAVSEEEYE